MSVNSVHLIGNVGKIETREVGSGMKVANLSLATTEKGYTTSSGVEKPEKTQWHNLTIWGKTAEVAEKYITAGSKIYVSGKLVYEQYENKDGVKMTAAKIEVERLELLGSKKESSDTPAPKVTAAVEDDSDLPF